MFTANEENDFFSAPEKTDKHYTQGIHFNLLWPDDEVPWLALPLALTPPLGFQEPTQKFGFEVGQDLYTPINLSTSLVVTIGRDAGWLYVGGIRAEIAASPRIRFRRSIVTRCRPVSPTSRTRGTDSSATAWLRAGATNSRTSPARAVAVGSHVAHRGPGRGRWRACATVPRAGVALWQHPDLGAPWRDGAPRLPYPGRFAATIPPKQGWYVFSDVGGRGVLYNEFLNGSVFHAGPTVDPVPGGARTARGCGVRTGPQRNQLHIRVPEQGIQRAGAHDAYGSLTYTYRF